MNCNTTVNRFKCPATCAMLGAGAPPASMAGTVERQLAGAALTIVGTTASVVGLHGFKRHRGAPRRMLGSLLCWGGGQAAQLLALALATQSVVAAMTNVGIWVNAYLSRQLLHEQVGMHDLLASCVLTVGCLLVVAFAPLLEVTHLTIGEVGDLLAHSAIPLYGLFATATIATPAVYVLVSERLKKKALHREALDGDLNGGCLNGEALDGCLNGEALDGGLNGEGLISGGRAIDLSRRVRGLMISIGGGLMRGGVVGSAADRGAGSDGAVASPPPAAAPQTVAAAQGASGAPMKHGVAACSYGVLAGVSLTARPHFSPICHTSHFTHSLPA